MNYDALVNMTATVGTMLLENGAEIYRVEESMNRIFNAYGLERGGDVFAIPSCIIVTVSDSEGHSYTKLKRVESKGTNLYKVERFNDLCRSICRDTPDFEKVFEDIKKINEEPQYNFLMQVLSRSLIASAFTLFFGGTVADAACALVCGAAIKLTSHNMERFQANNFFTNIVASAVASAFAILFVHIGWAANVDKMIIGTFMNLVPGVAITNLMRDMIAGDLMAGIAKLTESLLVATAIALGAGIALSISRMILGG